MGLTARHHDLLEARGLDVELLERLGVDSSPERGADWISIPFVVDGEVVNNKHRTISGEKRFSQDAGARKCFWNQDVITDKTLAHLPLVITEGEFDAIAAIQAGFARAVSVPDGAPAEQIGADEGSRKYSYLEDARGILGDIREIILATDSDGPGINLMNDLAVRLGKHRCKWVRYPPKCKDLNDTLRKHDSRGVVEVLTNAQFIKVSGVYRMSELPPIQQPVPHPIGILGLDKHWKIRLGDFSVITGIPSHGKTSFVNEVMCRMAVDYGWSIAVASFEQQPQTDHRRALRTFHNRKLVVYQTQADLAAADKWIDEHFAFIVPDEDEDAELKWVIERCQAAVVQHGCKLVVIDPWNEMDHIRPPDMSLTEYTGFAIKQFKKLARRFQCHVAVVAHPTKISRGKDGALPVPTLYDISDSAHWTNKSDVGVVVFREYNPSRTLIRVQKVRFDEIGEPGDLYAVFNRETGRFDVSLEIAA